MKRLLSLMLFAGFLISGFDCSKSKNVVQVQDHYLKGRVFEYGSEMPIANVSYSFYRCLVQDYGSCSKIEHISGTTNTDGYLVVIWNYYNILSGQLNPNDRYEFTQTGYWNNGMYDFFGSPQSNNDIVPVIFFQVSSSPTDSFHVKLFPVVNVSLHIKNNNGTLQTAYLDCHTLAQGIIARGTGMPVTLRSGIDTTFNFPVFGNIQNKIYIKKTNSDGTVDTLTSHTQFIAKNDVVSIAMKY